MKWASTHSSPNSVQLIPNFPACMVKSEHSWWVLSLELIPAKIWKAITSLGNKKLVIHPIQVFKPFHSTNTNKLTLSSKTLISNFPYLTDLSKTLPVSLPMGLKDIVLLQPCSFSDLESLCFDLIWIQFINLLSLLKVPRIIKWRPLLGGWITVLTTQDHNELTYCLLPTALVGPPARDLHPFCAPVQCCTW